MTAWRMSFRDGKNGPEMWGAFCLPLKVAAIEYGPVDDINFSPYTAEEEFPEHVKKAWSSLDQNRQTSLRRFLFEMKSKDIIYVKKGPMIVGKGVVGPYRFDSDGNIQSSKDGAYWQHQRPVKWDKTFPELKIQIGKQQVMAVVKLDDEDVHRIEKALGGHKHLSTLSAQEADQAEPFIPKDGDWREIVDRQIRNRRGSQKFRNALRKRYGDCCLVTGCKVLEVLEAAHIKPYKGQNDNHAENGLLLRSDIHTLFDLDMLGIEPDGLRVKIHPSLAKEYKIFAGKKLRCPAAVRPSKDALKLRYEQFQQKVGQ